MRLAAWTSVGLALALLVTLGQPFWVSACAMGAVALGAMAWAPRALRLRLAPVALGVVATAVVATVFAIVR